jgi:DNA-binding FadR family transcriptional regulator
VLVSPAPSTLNDFSLDRHGRTSVLLMVHDPESRPQATSEILEKSLGIPPGAARLVAALAADDDLKSFAEREGVTIHTARFHLRTALTRTGTRTQLELVRLAVRLLRDFALRADRGA